MYPYFKGDNKKKKKPQDEKCYIYKRTDGTEKELELDVHRSFLLFRYFNHNIPENNSPLLPTHLSDEEMRVVYKCILLSYLSYKDRNLIEFPPEIKIEYEKFDSTVGRIPFFIVTDTSINAIIISCRGSSCMDDFITDSMGNGVPYDGGKFHEGVFNTASYVFYSCQNKVIELNQTFNHESVESHQISDDSQNQGENNSISDDDDDEENGQNSKSTKNANKLQSNNDNDNDNDDDDEESGQNKKSARNVNKVKRFSRKQSNIDNDNDNNTQDVEHNLQSRKSTKSISKMKRFSRKKSNIDYDNDDDDARDVEHNLQSRKSTKSISKMKRFSRKKSNMDNDDAQDVEHNLQSRKSINNLRRSFRKKSNIDNDDDAQDIEHILQRRRSTRRFKKVKSMLDQIEVPTDLFNQKKKERTKIIFTGHSLGAAVAGVVTYLFRKRLPQLDAHCICFAPPPTMTFNIWQRTGSYIKSFMIEGDLVPFLSVQNLLHISDIMFPGQTSNQAFKSFVHKYLKKKSVEEVQAIAVLTDTFYPPGQMYLLRFTDNKTEDESNNKSKKKKKKERKKKDVEEDNIQLCQILNPDYFSSFVKNIQESNHASKNYMRMIIRLMRKNVKYVSDDSESTLMI